MVNQIILFVSQKVSKAVEPNLGRESQLEETMGRHVDFQKNLG
jgi:hypothetical protein